MGKRRVVPEYVVHSADRVALPNTKEQNGPFRFKQRQFRCIRHNRRAFARWRSFGMCNRLSPISTFVKPLSAAQALFMASINCATEPECDVYSTLGHVTRTYPPHAARPPNRDLDTQAQAAGLDPGHATHGATYRRHPARAGSTDRQQEGKPYQHENYLGDAVSEWRDKTKLRSELTLRDARGTAATRLLEAGADLKEIAVHMGWSIKHASEVIERYVALSPAMSDTLAAKLAEAEARTKLQTDDLK